MAHGFKLLAEFLDQFSAEVEGRARFDPPDENKKKIRAFARGELAGPEREERVNLLKENANWVEILAEEVKALRSASSPRQRSKRK